MDFHLTKCKYSTPYQVTRGFASLTSTMPPDLPYSEVQLQSFPSEYDQPFHISQCTHDILTPSIKLDSSFTLTLQLNDQQVLFFLCSNSYNGKNDVPACIHHPSLGHHLSLAYLPLPPSSFSPCTVDSFWGI